MCCCFCFPSTACASVWTRTGSHLIPHLRPSDELETIRLSGNGKSRGLKLKPDSFYTYLHFDAEARAEFLTIKCEDEAQLTITGSHLLFRRLENGAVEAVPADKVRIGDSLVHVTRNRGISEARVMEIGCVRLTGVYAPLTESGTLIVDGFLVSCYADVKSHRKAHAITAPLRLWYRQKRKALKQRPESRSRDNNGIHGYANFLIQIRKTFPWLGV
jgi:hypothetical protein